MIPQRTNYYIIAERREPGAIPVISNYQVSKDTYNECLKNIHESKKRKEGYV